MFMHHATSIQIVSDFANVLTVLQSLPVWQFYRRWWCKKYLQQSFLSLYLPVSVCLSVSLPVCLSVNIQIFPGFADVSACQCDNFYSLCKYRNFYIPCNQWCIWFVFRTPQNCLWLKFVLLKVQWTFFL